MSGILCSQNRVTREQVDAIPVPEATASWRPVPYGQAIDFLNHQAQTQLGLEVESSEYGLNKAGDQLFAVTTFKTDREDNGLSIGLRQSYNKSLALGVAVGAQVFVCDNLCFSGSAFKVVRKNTVNVWGDFQKLVTGQISDALGHYEAMNQTTDRMKAVPCHQQRGFALLGVAIGQGLLTPNQASIAFADWKTPRHEDFAERNVWSLYNCVTEGLKKGAPARLMDRHAAAHDYFTGVVG